MDELLKTLAQTKIETLKCFDFSNELLAQSYAPDKWSIRHLLHHLADAETVLYDRIRRIISEPKQVLWAFDQDLWAKRLDYSQLPLDLSKNIYSSVRESVIYYAGLHYKNGERLEFVHSEAGVRTLKDEFEKVAWHNEHHLGQIKKAISIFSETGGLKATHL